MVGTRSTQKANDRISRLRTSQVDKTNRTDSSASPSRLIRTQKSKTNVISDIAHAISK